MLKTEISNVEVSVYVTLLFSWYIIIYRNVFLNLNSTYLIVYYPKKMYKNVYSSFDFCFLNLFVDCFRWTFRHHCQIFLFILDKNLSNKWRIVNYIHISWIELQLNVFLGIKSLLAVQNNYRLLFRGKVRLCSLLSHTLENILLTPIVQYILDTSNTNILDGCPFKAVHNVLLLISFRISNI